MNKHTSSNAQYSKSTVSYVIAMVVFTLLISYIDSLLPQGVSIGEAYAILVLIGFMAKDSRLVIIGAIVGTVLTLEGYFISEHGVDLWIVWTNRLLSIFIIWAVAIIALGHLRLLEDRKESEKVKKSLELVQREISYSRTLKEISILCNSSDPVEDALKQSMQKICEFTGWTVAHIYLVNADEEILGSSKIWILSDWDKFAEFKKLTEATDFRPGIGLPGRVLSSNKVSWIKDLSKDNNFPRADIALKNGLQSGFAFPVLIGRKIIAIMEFYSNEILEDDPKLIEFLESLSFLLGRPFERDHAGLRKADYENHLKRLYSRMKAVGEEEQINRNP